MTPEDLARFRERLLAMRSELAEAETRGRAGQAIVELDQQSVGRLARMDALQNQAMARAGGRRREGAARRIDEALARIEAGSYGDCLECGEEIAPRRLELDPTIPLCISCAAG
jgi:DnaK suppressor protein